MNKFIVLLFLIVTCTKYTLGEKRLPSIYVYDDPAVDWSFLVECYEEKYGISPMLDERVEHAQNTGEIWMHRSALSYENRVYDPKEADLFYLPLYISLSSDMNIRSGSLKCQGKSHSERMHDALEFIKKSEFYITKGGSDHMVTCTWFWCGHAIGDAGRVVLSRSIIGINESNNEWAMWECTNRILTVPYTASSVVTRKENVHVVSNTTMSTRTIPFYFAGTSRDQPDRKNLAIVSEIEPSSEIHLTDNSFKWDQTPEQFANTVMRSRFCFAPRGDTLSSRRLFDAVAAGCIPIITDEQIRQGIVPFSEIIDYRKFCVVVNSDTFSNKHRLRGLVNGLLGMKYERYSFLRTNLNDARPYLVYGNVDKEYVEPGTGVFRSFAMLAFNTLKKEGHWACTPVPVYLPHATRVTTEYFPPTNDQVDEWSSGNEVMVSRENKFLICSPDHSNSEYSGEFIAGIIGASKWNGKRIKPPGFDVLDVGDYEFYDIFMGLSWIKAIYTRDPVVRILDLYLSDISTDESGQLDVHGFQEFIRHLHDGSIKVTGNLKPISRHCGFKYTHYPTVIPSESVHIGKSFAASLPEPMKNVSQSIDFFKEDSVRESLNSCEYSSFYNSVTLDYVYEIYEEDYKSFGVYKKDWGDILSVCDDYEV